jgi:hypothetical protein
MLMMLYSALLWCILRIARSGMTWQRGAVVGLLCAAGLLTKMSFACAMPLLLVLMLWRSARELRYSRRRMKGPLPRKIRRRDFSKSTIAGWLLLFALPLYLSGWWYRETLGSSSARLLQSSYVESKIKTPDGKPASKPRPGLGWEGALRQKVTKMPIIGEIGLGIRVMISYWGNFGWVNVRIPSALWLLLLPLSLAAIFSGLRRLWCAQFRDEYSFVGLETRRSRRALFLLGGASIALLLFYAFVDWRTRVTTGGAFGLRGGYYLPAVAGQMAWLMVGAVPRSRRKINKIWLMGSSMIALNFFCLLGVIVPRYYGDSSWWDVVQHVALLHPISNADAFLICSAAIASSTLLLIVAGSSQAEKQRQSLASH